MVTSRLRRFEEIDQPVEAFVDTFSCVGTAPLDMPISVLDMG